MRTEVVVGATLLGGLVVFMVGAGGWRMAYQQPRPESLRATAADRFRWRWIHLWMIAAMFVTPAALIGLVSVPSLSAAGPLPAMAAMVYALGAVCWIVSLVFRLTVVPWAAAHLVRTGEAPAAFAPMDDWAGFLYVVHMLAAYATFVVLGAAVLVGDLPAWLGWLGIGWGGLFTLGFVLTRFAGPFNPPLWAHTYTAVVGVVLLATVA